MLQGAVPVRATDKLVGVAEHTVAVPLIMAVGNGLTVTTALPVKEVAVQLTSLAAVKVYVLEAEGVTVITRGLVVIPVMVTGVVPSV